MKWYESDLDIFHTQTPIVRAGQIIGWDERDPYTIRLTIGREISSHINLCEERWRVYFSLCTPRKAIRILSAVHKDEDKLMEVSGYGRALIRYLRRPTPPVSVTPSDADLDFREKVAGLIADWDAGDITNGELSIGMKRVLRAPD